MSSLKRLIWCALLFGIQSLYFPLNRFLKGGIEFKTPLDDYIPLWSLWVVPYVIIYIWWIAAFLWAAWKMDERSYEAFFTAAAFVCVAGLMIFALFPTYVVRPPAAGTDWPTQLLNYIYANDHMYNAFPSGHVYVTTLIALFWSRWYPKWKWLWVSSMIVIALATLFTHQHYLPDPIGGLVLAWIGYRIGLLCVSGRQRIQQPIADSI